VWWADLCSIARELSAAVPTGDRIAGVGVSAIGPCVLPLDEGGRPLRPAILYGVDTRATDQIAALESRYGATELERWSGMELGSQAAGPKIAWLADNEPDTHARARWFATSTTYLVYRLTGEMVIDARTASHFNPLFDRSTIGWSDRYADGITPIGRLASIGWPADVAGTITADAAAATGLPVGAPVAVGTLDALSEAISVGVARPGDLMIMYGSTTFFITVTAEPIEAGKLWLTAGSERGTWALSGGLATGGSALRWFRDELAPDLVAAEAAGGEAAYAALSREAEVAEAAPGREGLAFLPYFSGERTPINDPLARGVVTGLSLASGRGDMYLGLLQGIAYATRSNIEAMKALGAPIQRAVAVGGGTADPLLLQVVSDACGIEQEIPGSTIGAARGDAILAGLASGVLARADIDAWMSIDRVIRPRPEARAGHDHRYAAFCELYVATRDIVHRLGTESDRG
ncbi:MAG TPA: FGGY-family carbohydrate kinase, partial [Candidatus Limnocylindria bacterium]|nr:FGGY-family carbohydrate kinase [Candidatus Limnocylindria bacterium]